MNPNIQSRIKFRSAMGYIPESRTNISEVLLGSLTNNSNT